MPVKKYRKSKASSSRLLPKILILAGIVVMVVVVFLVKNMSSKPAMPVEVSPEAQFDQYLKEGRPTFVFFHSTNCHSCIVMMGTVYQVYPEFEDSISLVDVDVYDPQNQNLLRRVGINSIPTLFFIDRKGQGKISIGVMEVDQLRQELQILKETP